MAAPAPTQRTRQAAPGLILALLRFRYTRLPQLSCWLLLLLLLHAVLPLLLLPLQALLSWRSCGLCCLLRVLPVCRLRCRVRGLYGCSS